MIKYSFLLGLIIFLESFCGFSNRASQSVNPRGSTIETRFPVPSNFERENSANNTFASYLRTLSLKPNKSAVHLYNGSVKANSVHEAVINMDIGNKNLQQCADAVMRLRAEYLFKQKRYADIHFNFTNGFAAEYVKWACGYRIKVTGNRCCWVNSADTSYSYQTFRKYLDVVFTYAGTLSLSKEMKPVPVTKIQVGDVFIIGGSPGHAVIVVDLCVERATGKKLFMIAQSYMPAQEIHVLKNPNHPALSPWYELNEQLPLVTPEWTFAPASLKRF